MTKKSLLGKLKRLRFVYSAGILMIVIDGVRNFIYEPKSPFSDFTLGDAGLIALAICVLGLSEVVYWVCRHYVENNMKDCCTDGKCMCNKS